MTFSSHFTFPYFFRVHLSVDSAPSSSPSCDVCGIVDKHTKERSDVYSIWQKSPTQSAHYYPKTSQRVWRIELPCALRCASMYGLNIVDSDHLLLLRCLQSARCCIALGLMLPILFLGHVSLTVVVTSYHSFSRRRYH